MNVPGITAQHAVITPNCRKVQGGDDGQAFDEAMQRLRSEYLNVLYVRGVDDKADYHVVLSVEPKGVG